MHKAKKNKNKTKGDFTICKDLNYSEFKKGETNFAKTVEIGDPFSQ